MIYDNIFAMQRNINDHTGARVAQWVRSLHLTIHTSLSPIWRGFALGFVNYKKRCTRLAAASGKVYQLLAHGRWFSPGTPASSTTKTGRHDIAEILLKMALKHQKSIKSINEHTKRAADQDLLQGDCQSPNNFVRSISILTTILYQVRTGSLYTCFILLSPILPLRYQKEGQGVVIFFDLIVQTIIIAFNFQ